MNILWIFFGGHQKTGLVVRVVSMHFRYFHKVNVQKVDFFLAKFSNIFLVYA